MLQNTSSENRTFICIGALDECMPEHRVKLPGSPNRILQKSLNSSLEAEILEKIPEEISEMYVETAILVKLSTDRYAPSFLLVSLSIGAIIQETTIHRRRQKLRGVTDGLGLGDAYGATPSRIKGQGGESEARDGHFDVDISLGATPRG